MESTGLDTNNLKGLLDKQDEVRVSNPLDLITK